MWFLRSFLVAFLALASLAIAGNSADAGDLPDRLKLKLKNLDKFKVGPKLTLKAPDLHIASAADLTGLSNGPLSSAMWVRIGNQGTVTANNIRVNIYFWKLVNTAGKIEGKIYHTRQMTIASLAPGGVVKLFPYDPSVPSGAISWGVKVDPNNAIFESREGNNRTGRLWTMYPDAFLRAYSYEAMP